MTWYGFFSHLDILFKIMFCPIDLFIFVVFPVLDRPLPLPPRPLPRPRRPKGICLTFTAYYTLC